MVVEEAIKSEATGTGASQKLHTGLLVGQVSSVCAVNASGDILSKLLGNRRE